MHAARYLADRALSAENAYFGLAGMYIMTDNASEGGCGEPWNLDGLPDTEMIIKDAVLDETCQLYYDHVVSSFSQTTERVCTAPSTGAPNKGLGRRAGSRTWGACVLIIGHGLGF